HPFSVRGKPADSTHDPQQWILGSARFQRAAFGILPNACLIIETECLPQDSSNGPQDAGAPQEEWAPQRIDTNSHPPPDCATRRAKGWLSLGMTAKIRGDARVFRR